jgi:hypothetical protein
MTARLIQAKALLLLTVFLSAGTSLPSLDALAHHGIDKSSERSRTHVEPAGGCLSHADGCSLGRTASGSGAVAAAEAESRLVPTSSPVTQHSSHIQPVCADPGALHHSRAPPTLRYV